MNLDDHFKQYSDAIARDMFDKEKLFEFLKAKKSTNHNSESDFKYLSNLLNEIKLSMKNNSKQRYCEFLTEHQKMMLKSMSSFVKTYVHDGMTPEQKRDRYLVTNNVWRFSPVVVEMSIESEPGHQFYIIPRYSNEVDQSRHNGVVSVREYELLREHSYGHGSAQSIITSKKAMGYPCMVTEHNQDGSWLIVRLQDVNVGKIRDWTLNLRLDTI